MLLFKNNGPLYSETGSYIVQKREDEGINWAETLRNISRSIEQISQAVIKVHLYCILKKRLKNLTPWANPNHIQVYKPSHSSTAHKLSWIRHIPAYLKHDVAFRQNPHWAADIWNMQWNSRPPSYCNISANHTHIPFWKLLNDERFHLVLRFRTLADLKCLNQELWT